MHNNDAPTPKEQAQAAEAARAEEQAAADTAKIAEIIDQEARSIPAVEGEEVRFTREQVERIAGACLAYARKQPDPAEAAAQKLAYDEMLLTFKQELLEHGMPADELLRFFRELDLTTLEGLRYAVDAVLQLQTVILEYAERYEAAKAARANMPQRKKTDVFRQIFGLEEI